MERSKAGHRTAISTRLLAKMMRSDYEKDGCRWKERDVMNRCLERDPSAKRHTAARVLSILRSPSLLKPEMEMQLIQGLGAQLVKKGFGVVLHVARAGAVRAQILEVAR